MQSTNISIIKALLVCGILIAGKAFAIKPFAPSPLEMRMLPPYCVAKLGADKNAAVLWQQRLGSENFEHMHHYCFGVNFMNRARIETNPNDRNHYLNSAIAEFGYVIRTWSPTFQLTRSAKTYTVQAQSMLRR